MGTLELNFHKITLDDQPWIRERLNEERREECEYTFANNFIWRKVYEVEIADIHECGVMRFKERGRRCYSYPIGKGDKKRVLEELLEYCHEKKETLVLAPLNETDRKQLLEWFPGKFCIQGDRDDYDYVYSREKLATLAGKKLHGKRNHIARFKDDDDWVYERITSENMEECRRMSYSWIQMREEKWNDEMEQEIMVMHEAFDHMQELGLVGGLIRKAGEIVAFSVGEPLNEDTFVVHFEKAFPDMQGAYPMINQQFVLHECENYSYVNREEDTGDLGLRKAKLSYYPEILQKKYVAVESEVIFADKEKDHDAIIEIWKNCFHDEEELIEFYIEHRMKEDNMLVIYEDGKAVSMASFLPATIENGEEPVNIRYIYAVATLPQYRKKGYAAKIVKTASEIFGEPFVLVPATEQLVSYYEQLGFEKAFINQEQSFAAKDLEMSPIDLPASLEEINALEYCKIRNHKLKKDGYVNWDEQAIAFAIDFNKFCGGKTVEVVWENDSTREEKEDTVQQDILMYCPEKEKLNIIETTLGEEQLKQLLPEVMTATNTTMASYSIKSGMVFLLEEKKGLRTVLNNGFLNLILA